MEHPPCVVYKDLRIAFLIHFIDAVVNDVDDETENTANKEAGSSSDGVFIMDIHHNKLCNTNQRKHQTVGPKGFSSELESKNNTDYRQDKACYANQIFR